MSGENKPTILVSAYDGAVSRLIEMSLKAKDYHTILVPHSDEAIPRIPESHLIISDVLNGVYDLYESAKKCNPKIPVIIMNGGLLENEKTPDAILIGKPFSPNTLVALVNEHFPQHLKPPQTPPTA